MSENPVITSYIVEFGVDLDGQRVDPEWIEGQIVAWMERGGFVTAMFQGNPVAVCEYWQADGRGIRGTVRSLDHETSERIRAGLYKGLGVGIAKARVTKDEVAPNGVIDGGTVTAVSLLDEPMRYDEP